MPNARPSAASSWLSFQRVGQVLNVGQEASSLFGILGLVTAGGITPFRGEHAIAQRPIITDPPVIVETRLAWRSASISGVRRRFIETSHKAGKGYML